MKLRTTLAICAALVVSTIFASAQSNSEIAGKKWKLTEVEGVAVTRGNAHLQFDANTNKYHGSSGCNFIAGNYKVEGTRLSFSEGIITRRACSDPEVQKIETEFLKLFDQTTNFQIQDDILRLYKGDQLTLVFKTGATEKSN